MQQHLTTESKSINDSFTLPVIDANNPITTFDKDVLLATTIRYFSTLPVLYDDPNWFYDECTLWWDQYKYDFARMWMTNEMEYNPIYNYDRHEEETTTPGVTETEAHNGSDTETHSGSDINAKAGTDTTAKTGHDDLERQGKMISDTDTMQNSTENVENQVSAFNESTYQPSSKSSSSKTYNNGLPDNAHQEVSHQNDKDVQTYESTDTLTHDITDTLTHGEVITDAHGHVITHSKTGYDHRELDIHGNIGVTTTQQMMEQEYNIRKFNLYTYMADKFVDNMCLGIW